MSIKMTRYIIWGILLVSINGSIWGAQDVASHPINQQDKVTNNKECVVVLHGLWRTARSMTKVVQKLEGLGYTVFNVNYPSRKYPIETLVEQYVAPAIARCQSHTKTHVVAHSLGGILLRYFLVQDEIPNLGQVVLLAPPNNGSVLVDKLRWIAPVRWIMGPTFTQLSTQSDSIPQQLPTPNFNLGIIMGSRSFNPLFSALIPGEDDGIIGLNTAMMTDIPLKTVRVGHTWIMRNSQVLDYVVAFIKEGKFD